MVALSRSGARGVVRRCVIHAASIEPMKITYTLQCCDCMPNRSFDREYAAIEALLNHIIKSHPSLYAKLKKFGRRLAQSQNGRGYFDRGKSSNDGWHKAMPTFRRAWIVSALKHHLRWPNEFK